MQPQKPNDMHGLGHGCAGEQQDSLISTQQQCVTVAQQFLNGLHIGLLS
jgi:hypothetical protein